MPLPADADAPDRGLVLERGYRDLHVFRVDAAGCAELVGQLDTDGPLAFVEIEATRANGTVDLAVDTWLMHGDRRREHYACGGGACADTGGDEEIPGPHRRR